jgi:hypothetical protein
MTITTELPSVPGPYWHRKSAGEPWELLKLSDLGDEGMHAYSFSGDIARSLIKWQQNRPVGQWVAIERPPE